MLGELTLYLINIITLALHLSARRLQLLFNYRTLRHTFILYVVSPESGRAPWTYWTERKVQFWARGV